MTPTIKTASWFTKLPDDCQRIGISRSSPRNAGAGYRLYRKLAPGSWFNDPITPAEYARRYQVEVLDRLDPHQVAAELHELAGGRVPVLLCFERAGTSTWCHRSFVAAFLAEGLGVPVPEFGFEHLTQAEHPLHPVTSRIAMRPAPQPRLPF